MGDLFKEFFFIGALPLREQTKYYLICRYSKKASARLLEEKEILFNKGKELFDDDFKLSIKTPNPFLSLIEKNHDFEGKYIPVPIVFKSV